MLEHDAHGYHWRLRWPGDRLAVVDRLGSPVLRNKNNPRGSLCSIEHDLLAIFLPFSAGGVIHPRRTLSWVVHTRGGPKAHVSPLGKLQARKSRKFGLGTSH